MHLRKLSWFVQKPTCASTQVKFLSAPSLALAEANRKKSLVLVSHWVLRRHSAAKGTEDGHLKTKLRSIKRYKIMRWSGAWEGKGGA